MTVICANILQLNGTGWDFESDEFFTQFSIFYNLKTGFVELREDKQCKTNGQKGGISIFYATPAEFVFDYCLRYKRDIRDYADISELDAGVESLLYCYLVHLQESLHEFGGEPNA